MMREREEKVVIHQPGQSNWEVEKEREQL